jgi:hypothetical protein
MGLGTALVKSEAPAGEVRLLTESQRGTGLIDHGAIQTDHAMVGAGRPPRLWHISIGKPLSNQLDTVGL